ncbi:MAG TPA: hypothetical protein VGE52_02205, partial [Pirellulales bacterium]
MELIFAMLPTLRRRWLRISLGGFLLVTILAALALVSTANSSRHIRAALDAIQRAGGSVVCTYQDRDGTLDESATEPGWVLALRRLGIDLPPTALFVHFSGKAPTDDVLRQVAELKFVHTVLLFNAPLITDAGVAHLGELPRLKMLVVHRSSITGSCANSLASAASLEAIDFTGSKVTGVGLSALKRLSELRVLRLADCPVSDEGTGEIASISQLTSLRISGDQLTPAGLGELARLTNVDHLQVLTA